MTGRVAVVGLGWAARTIWLPRLDRHPDWTVTALVDPDPAARAQAAEQWPGARILAGPDDLGPGDVDLVVVATPNHAHSAVVCPLLARGLPVFLEKPVCLSSAEAQDLAEAERKGQTVLLAGSAARLRGDIAALAALIPSLGPVRHVRADWVRARGVPGTGWFTRRDLSGGGVLVDLGWHLLDTTLGLLGPAAVDQAAGTVGADFLGRADSRAAWKTGTGDGPAAGDVEDTVRAFLVTEHGVSVSLHAAWASHAAHDSTLIEVSGGDGTATLRCTFGFSPDRRGGSTLTVARDGRDEQVALPDEPIGAEYDRQVDALAGLLADPDGPGRAIEEARRTIGVVEAVYASARRSAGRRPAREQAWTAA